MIELAGKKIEITTLHEDTKKLCRDYEIEGAVAPDFSILTTREDIEYERERSRETARLEGRKDIEYSDGYLETLAVYRKIAEAMIDDGVILFHGSALAIDGKGCILAARSGTGKSTLARHLREVMGERVVMINDDKPLVSLSDGEVRVHGTPWNGKHRIGNNVNYPLNRIYILERSKEPWIERVAASDVLPEIMQQVYRPSDAELLLKTMKVLDGICSNIECYRVGIVPDDGTARLIARQGSLEDELDRNGWIIHSNVGQSMEPLIRQGKDLMIIEKRPLGDDGRSVPLAKYDAVLFKRDDGKLVLHRIVGVRNSGDDVVYDICGDNQVYVERGVRDHQVIGILTKVLKDTDTDQHYEMAADDAEYMKYIKRRIKILPWLRAKYLANRAIRKLTG